MQRVETPVIMRIVVLATVVTALLFSSTYIFGFLGDPNTGSSGIVADVAVAVYTNSAGTRELNAINWGICYPGDSVDVVAYLKNQGTLNVTLTINTNAWDPANASTFFTLSTDYVGQTLAPEEVVPVTFTLTTSPNVDGASRAFSFDVVITSQEEPI